MGKYLGIAGLFCLFVVSCLLLMQGEPFGAEVPASQCFKCHTNARTLIEITREIAKTRPVIKPANEGEG
jgi:hypothetical protein